MFAKVPLGLVVAQLKRKGRNIWAEAKSQQSVLVDSKNTECRRRRQRGRGGSREGPDTRKIEPGHRGPHGLEELLIDFVLPEVGGH